MNELSFRHRALVTGGMGFIGSALVRHLVGDRGWRVLNVDKLTYAGDPATVAAVADDPRHRFVRADICDGAEMRRLLAEHRPDAVLHLAAESHVDRSIDRPAAFVETNLVGTFTLLQAALDYWRGLPEGAHASFRFLHVSTDEVFGSLPLDGGAAFDEHTPYAPNSPYSASKAGSDHLARAWAHTYGLPVVVGNCSNNYGPFQFPEKLIPTMIIAALEGRPLPIYGTGANVRDWLFVEDHVRALATLVERGRPGECYAIGGGAERSNLDLVRALCAQLDELLPESPHRPHAELITFVPDRPGHDLRYAINDAKIRSELGWRPEVDLDAGLRRTVAWYVENRAWWERIRRERHDGRRLGLMGGEVDEAG